MLTILTRARSLKWLVTFERSITKRFATMSESPSTKRHLIYWVRHGETEGNYERMYRDPMTAFLTDRGRVQSKLVGQVLSDVVFTRAYSSNLPRAIETAKILLEQSKHSSLLESNTDKRIRERDHGNLEGKSYDVGNSLRGKGINENDPLFPYAFFCVEGTENVLKIIERAASFFQDLIKSLDKSSREETVLIVSHGYFTNLWMTHLGLPNSNYKVTNYSDELTISLQNCGYHTVRLSTGAEQNTVLCWEFLEFQKDEHLFPAGFACIRD